MSTPTMNTVTQAEKDARAMDAAHESWKAKTALVEELNAVAARLASNIFLEYRDIRGCSIPAASREAREWTERYAQHAVSDALAKINRV